MDLPHLFEVSLLNSSRETVCPHSAQSVTLLCSQEYVHMGLLDVVRGGAFNKYQLNYMDNWIHYLLKMTDRGKRGLFEEKSISYP